MPSLIGAKVSEFYKPLSESPQLSQICKDYEQYFVNDAIYNWFEFGELFREEFKNGVTNSSQTFNSELAEFSNLQYDNFQRIVQKLIPIFMKSLNSLQNICNVSAFESHQHWLGPNGDILQWFSTDYVGTRSETSNVEWVLLLTSFLEYGLGNIYYSHAMKTPPHLLRDLLGTEEVFEVFGWEAICFLRILLGSPVSINLRNIVWHGFPEPQEISEYYVAVLILAINSLGRTILNRNLKLQLRPQLSQFQSSLIKIKNQLPSSDVSIEEMNTVLLNCDWVSLAYKTFWRRILYYKETQKYWKFVLLILPQIELLLRLIYTQANNYDVRAKIDEYYITIDTIFEVNLPIPFKEKLNMLLQPGVQCLNEKCFKLMYDLFVAPQGPRIRDKVSHGEVTLECINNVILCDILLQLSHQLFTYKKSSTDGIYESQFHINSLAWESIENARKNFLMQLTFLSELKILAHDETTEQLQRSLNSESIKIFHRPKQETELMQMILKISQLLSQISINYKGSIDERYKLYQQHRLYSKRRKTFERMVETMPEICFTIHSILGFLEMMYKHLQQDKMNRIFSQNKEFERLRRFLKQSLQICENLVKWSSKESNEWIKALELCKKFQSNRENLDIDKSFGDQMN